MSTIDRATSIGITRGLTPARPLLGATPELYPRLLDALRIAFANSRVGVRGTDPATFGSGRESGARC